MTVFLLEEIKQNIYLQRLVLVICLMEEYFHASNVFANSNSKTFIHLKLHRLVIFGKDTDL